MRSRVLIPVALFVTLIVTPLAAQGPLGGQTAADRHKSGHSKLGEAFDEGPRERPAKIDGIGRTSFPITTSKPEVQEWFDQGHTLLHSFWFFEAERSFRWAVKLDPDAPMPYWGLARTASGDRARAFLREASSRKARGTERERDYIEAWEVQYAERAANGDARKDFHRALERLILKYPDDVEAKALYAYEAMAENRVGTELLIRQVLAVDPNHPGAHHYRIHNWDDQDGAQALESCKRYGTLVPGIGHALHMPGHIYAGLGMYHEAAISLDSATRAEIAYMSRRMVFPYNTWNYAHNRNYLSYVQEQLGLPSEAIRGARELLAVPLDPKLNDATRFSPHWQGVAALTRALVKFEKWDDILAPGSIPWGTSLRDRLGRGYAEALAKIEKKDPAADLAVASFSDLKKDIEKPENSSYKLQFEVQLLELQGTYALKNGDAIKGLMLLTEAAPKELTLRAEYDDPPFFPTLMYSKLGYAYLSQNSPKLAADAFERALETVKNDPFALAGLARARQALGDTKAATAGPRSRPLRLERRRTRTALARRRPLDRHPSDGRRRLSRPAAQLPRHGPRHVRAGDLAAVCRPGARHPQQHRRARHARPVQGPQRDPRLLPRDGLRALRQPDQGALGTLGQVEGARRRRPGRERRQRHRERGVAGLAERPTARRRSVPQCAALQVVRRLRGDADSLHGAHRQGRPRPLGTPWRRALYRLRLPRLAAGADERARGEDAIAVASPASRR